MSKHALVAVGVMAAMGLLGCASSRPAEAPRQAVDRLLKLYQEDRTRFVRNMQKYEQEGDCDYVEQIKKEAEQMDFDGAAPKESDKDLKVVMMELAEAEKKCRD